MGDPHVLIWEIDHPVSQLCFNLGYRVYKILRKGIPMVRFYGLCDGKIRARKGFGFCVEKSSFYAKFRRPSTNC